jgi:hypothetical protein
MLFAFKIFLRLSKQVSGHYIKLGHPRSFSVLNSLSIKHPIIPQSMLRTTVSNIKKQIVLQKLLISVAVQFNVELCRRSVARVAGLNAAGGK